VIVPAAFPAANLADASARPELASRFEGAFGPGAPVFVATDREVFRTTAGDSDWQEIHRVRTPPSVAVGRVALGVGAAGLVGAAIPSILAFGNASGAAGDMTDATSTEAWTAASRDYDSAHGTFTAAVGAEIGAAAVGGLGVILVLTGPDPYGR
jgi:hypothetical protein